MRGYRIRMRETRRGLVGEKIVAGSVFKAGLMRLGKCFASHLIG